MRVAHIVPLYFPNVGGLERAVQRLAEEQARLGHEVHIITSVYGARGRPREEVINGVHVYRIKALKPYYPDLMLPREIPDDLSRMADIIHVHSQNSYFNIKIAEKARRATSHIAIHFMAVDALYDHPNAVVRFLGPYYAKYMLRKALSLAELKLVRSLRDLEILRSRYGVQDVYFLPDGIDKEFIVKEYMEELFRNKYGMVLDDIVLYIGRIHKLKGLEVLIKAVPIVVKGHRNVKFVIIGPGDVSPYKALAEKLNIENHIAFLGFVDENTKIGALDASICLVLPSISNYVEVYPMVISEAWARKRPVVATNIGGIPYRIKHMENGLLVPPNDTEKLAHAILTLLRDKELARKLGEKGYHEIKTWDEIAKMSIKLYQNVVK